MSSADIVFDPLTGNEIMTMDDHSVYTSNEAGQLLSAQVWHPPASAEPGFWTTTTYSAWDGDQRPIVGSGPDGSFTLGYHDGDTVMTMDGDHSVFTINSHDQLTSSVTPHQVAGQPDTFTTTTYSAWDGDQRPIVGSGPDGSFTLGYHDGDTVMTMDGDHSVFTINSHDQLTSSVTPHQVAGQPDTFTTTTFSAWDGDQRPIVGSGPDGSFTLGYQGGDTVMTMDRDHSVFTTNANNQLVSSVTAHHVDGQADTFTTTTYSAWDGDNRPIAGSGLDGGFALAYQGDDTIMTMDSDHSAFTTDADGHLVKAVTAHHVDGAPDTFTTTTYTAWNKDRQPIAGSGPDGSFTLAYHGGDTSMTMDADHSVFTTNANGELVSAVTAHHVDGGPDTFTTTTYTAWDESKQPTAGSGPDGSFTIAYQGGKTITTMDGDHSVFTSNANGQLESAVTPHHVDGQPDTFTTTTYTAWDGDKRPTAGSGPDGSFALAYHDGSTIMTMDGDHSVFTTNANGQLTSVVTPQHVEGQADTFTTTTYTAWDSDKRPTAGTGPDGSFTMAYQHGNTIMTMDGDHSVFTTNANGQLVSVAGVNHVPGQPDTVVITTYTAWDDQKRPTAGEGPNGSFALSYQDGSTVMTMDKDGTVFTFNADGQIVTVATVTHSATPGQPDTIATTTYTAWDDQDRPTAGSDDGGHFTIVYNEATGFETITYDSGTSQYTTIVLSGDGKLVSTTLPDGTLIDWYAQLSALGETARGMAKHEWAIGEAFKGIRGEFGGIKEAWTAPATDSFHAITTQFEEAAWNLVNVLGEATRRMVATYNSMVEAETVNAYPATGQKMTPFDPVIRGGGGPSGLGPGGSNRA